MQKIYTSVAIYFIKQKTKKKFEKFTISTNRKKQSSYIVDNMIKF